MTNQDKSSSQSSQKEREEQDLSTASSEVEKLDFETALDELEKIVYKLEQEELSLEKSIELFQQGVRLSKTCQNKLTQAEKTIEKLTRDENTGEINIEPIDFEEN